jgi:hypothetical protein
MKRVSNTIGCILIGAWTCFNVIQANSCDSEPIWKEKDLEFFERNGREFKLWQQNVTIENLNASSSSQESRYPHCTLKLCLNYRSEVDELKLDGALVVPSMFT